MDRFLRHYLLAVQYFTRVPVSGPLAGWVGFSPDMLRASAVHFPGVGWLIGMAACVVFAMLSVGLPDGPFRGVPFLLKDLHISVPGVRTTYGSQLFADFVPSAESELAARYRRAGLVVFGKTHSPELGLTTTSEPPRPFTRSRRPCSPLPTDASAPPTPSSRTSITIRSPDRAIAT